MKNEPDEDDVDLDVRIGHVLRTGPHSVDKHRLSGGTGQTEEGVHSCTTDAFVHDSFHDAPRLGRDRVVEHGSTCELRDLTEHADVVLDALDEAVVTHTRHRKKFFGRPCF